MLQQIFSLDLPNWLPGVLLWVITMLLVGIVLKARSYYGIALLILVARAAALSSVRNYLNSKELLEIIDAEIVRAGLYAICIALLVVELVKVRREESQLAILRKRVEILEGLLKTSTKAKEITNANSGTVADGVQNDGVG